MPSIPFREVILRPYTLMTGEDPALDCLSLTQLSLYYSAKVRQAIKECKLYPTLLPNKYYVVVGSTPDDIELVYGGLLLCFTVKILTLDELKRRVISCGVPILDKIAFSKQLELSFRQHILIERARIHRHLRYLQGIRDPLLLPKETLVELYCKIAVLRASYKSKVKNSKTEGERRDWAGVARVYNRHLLAVGKILRSKGSW